MAPTKLALQLLALQFLAAACVSSSSSSSPVLALQLLALQFLALQFLAAACSSGLAAACGPSRTVALSLAALLGFWRGRRFDGTTASRKAAEVAALADPADSVVFYKKNMQKRRT